MNPKRFAARTVAVTTGLVLVSAVSAGAYWDTGSWLGVAVVWGSAAVLMGLVWAFIWGTENWKADR